MRFHEQKWKWADLGKPNGQVCEECGTGCIDRCPQCGAPQCCPRCCTETTEYLRSFNAALTQEDA